MDGEPNFSPAYHEAVKQAAAHHAQSKTYSGMFLRPHAAQIKALIDRLQVKSILDYGCGKGKQYEWVSHDDATGTPKGQTLEQFWGMSVTRFDPCWPPYAARPAGRFDLVLCTHVLGSIPIGDLNIAKWDIYRFAEKAVYIAEKIGPIGKRVFEGAQLARGEEHGSFARRGWEVALRPQGRPGLEVWLSTREVVEGIGRVTLGRVYG